ncbi:MAG: YifB family Mg chelatase-like AAA ATPase [Candidatus Gastranaerophilales bacterium]|nr:YifB family Mg chelatase-like AAA ATPase [Candidatus Gastranaerophilales bacterium]
MVAHIKTATIMGIDGYLIDAEVDISSSLPGIVIVGLPDAAVSEAKERIKAAIKNCGHPFPAKKVIINLAPADIKKEGSGFDLPMAVGILACESIIDPDKIKDFAFIGELSLDGSLRPVNGVLPIAIALAKQGITKLILPKENVTEGALVEGIEVFPAEHLCEVVNMFSSNAEQTQEIKPFTINIKDFLSKSFDKEPLFDFKDVKGQQKAKRAMELAAAGGHNILLSGSPGAGKTLLAKCFAGILPPLSLSEALELTKIYSISGLLDRDEPLMSQRPFRSPHHSASAAGIIGGGGNPKPGEITLAHNGVLFLDEVVEFPRQVLEVLRQPLEDGHVTISRAQTSVKYPADFMLLAAMNPCPCGFYGDTEKTCVCGPSQTQRYWSRLSGPLLDRIDIQIEVPRLTQSELLNKKEPSESSKNIRERVINARQIQAKRFTKEGISSNSQMNPKLIKKYCKLTSDCEEMLKSAITRFGLSGRAFDRILKLSRTIADIDSAEDIKIHHIAEALQYRDIKR